VAELLTPFLNPSWHWVAYTLAALIQCVLCLVVALCSAAVFIWLERKVSARIQDRLGPTRVGGRFGWLQPPADGIKLLCKEDIIPTAADRPLFRIAPYISFCAVFCTFLALPFANGWVALELDAGAFFVLAVMGLEVFGVVLGGYASGSKWSLYGAMREAAQVVSYEIPLALCVVVPVLICGTMDLVKIGQSQAGWFFHWNLLHDPFTFVTFWVYVTCATASTNRAPFDLPEAESELVAGFLTEYSGFRWVIFFMAEYAAMFVVMGLAAVLFLGGWNGPVPIATWLGLTPEHGPLAAWIGNLLGMCNFIAKAVLGVTCMIWARWTLPRLRIDQVMTTCLKYCVPLASAMLAGVMLWTYALPSGLTATIWPPVAAMDSRSDTNDLYPGSLPGPIDPEQEQD
jgi:NADH-quinone oxidoreductase subunit H